MEIALVIPVFNEETTIKKVIKEVSSFVKKIIVVNDYSTDNSEKILKQLPITLINNQKNLGYAKTLEKGIITSFKNGADYVITFDADGQHKASDLKKFISVIEKSKPDLVLGKRLFKNRFMEDIFGIFSKLKYGFSDPLCGMKAYKKTLFEKYNFLEKKYSIATELTFKAIRNGASFEEISIESEKRLTESRFANDLKGNFLELKALINILFT